MRWFCCLKIKEIIEDLHLVILKLHVVLNLRNSEEMILSQLFKIRNILIFVLCARLMLHILYYDVLKYFSQQFYNMHLNFFQKPK